MADTGFLPPTSTGEDYNDWENPSNAFALDSNLARGLVGSDKQDYYDFSFGVPGGATIDGIEVTVHGGAYVGGFCRLNVELSWDGGDTYTSEGVTKDWFSSTISTQTWGGSSDEWGRTWSSGDFSDANFRLKVDTIFLYPSIDYIIVKVYYTAVAGGINPKVKVSGAFATKKTLVKIGGTFAEKPVKVKVGGTFQ